MQYNDISEYAREVLEYYTINNNRTLIEYIEHLNHDGYDCDGPESNLWDLNIIYEINNEKYCDNWHWEEWYTPNESKGYLENQEIKAFKIIDNNNNNFKNKGG